ncbi:MAG TPA: LPS export ABC transporter periplasmic protein LptC [Methylophilus sp.]
MFPLVLAFMLALITFWINQTVLEQGPKIDGSNRHDPDYRLKKFVTSQTDAAGNMRYVLAAAEMQHYPDDDSTVLKLPRFTQFAVDKPYTQIVGARGYVAGDGESIEFVDNVKVVRQATAEKGEMQLLTDKLTILPNQDMAKTNSAVRITQAPSTVVSGVGMEFDKKNQTMKLFNRVKVHYERPQPRQVKKAVNAKPQNTKRAVNVKKSQATKKPAVKKPAVKKK